jgi:CRISPR system Cascade subunit CasC
VSQGKTFDEAAGKKVADSVIKSLAKGTKSDKAEAAEADDDDKASDKKDNILLFSDAELDTLAQGLVDAQNGGPEATLDAFIQDFRSPSLDVAAFGRMFAAKANKSTHAAVAVSHAIMTHEMSLTIDYFTAVDEYEDEGREDNGAGHLGLSYYTSGVYYSTFTIDPDQLRRSWTGIDAPTAQQQVEALIKSLVEALPTGKLTNTNAHTKPLLVLVEHQYSRTVYEFETPVQKATAGGYAQPTIDALASQYDLARTYDAENYLDTLVYAPTATGFEGAKKVASIDELAGLTASLVFDAVEEKLP